MACVFIGCNILAAYNQPDARDADSPIQINLINADKYFYSKHNYRSVILGSSLASKIDADQLPGFYNLALIGMSVYDGGAVLLSRNPRPQTVYIELNVIQRPENESFTGQFNSPLYIWLKSALPALRSGNQPIMLAKKAIEAVANRNKPAPAPVRKQASTKKPALKNTYLPQRMFKPLLDVQLKAYSQRDTALINASVIKLKQLVAQIQARGSRVVFFEMPINPALEQLPKTVLIRNAVKQAFAGYPFINLPPATFKTRDGLHLAQKEAVDYTEYFKGQINLKY